MGEALDGRNTGPLTTWWDRASDPTKPWPDEAETEEILKGGK